MSTCRDAGDGPIVRRCTECDCTYPPHRCPDCGVATGYTAEAIELATWQAWAAYKGRSLNQLDGAEDDFTQLLPKVEQDRWREVARAVAESLAAAAAGGE